MQTLTEQILALKPPGGLFDETVIVNLFGDRSANARKVLVHRAVSTQEVLCLKPGLFCLAQRYLCESPHPFVVAATLHSPSHVSLESALHFHQLIPEAVFQVSSVTVQRSRTFETPLGTFSFDRVPAQPPRAGVCALRITKQAWAFVASPIRAIADLVYLRKSVSWDHDGLRFLTDSMRIEPDDLATLDFSDSELICASIRNKRTVRFLQKLERAINT